MAYQVYKFITTQAHEVSGWTILSILLHVRASHLGGINGDIQSYQYNLALKQGEQLDKFHIRILRLQQ